MDLTCPHCGGALELVPHKGNRTAQELDLNKLITVYSTEQRVTAAWSPQWAPTAEAHLRRYLSSGLPLTRSGIADWKRNLLEGNRLSVRTVNSHLASLGALCEWLVSRGELPTNPARGQSLKGAKVAASEERLQLTPAEVRILLDYVEAHAPDRGFKLLAYGMAYTGARNEELAQLKVGDVKEHEGVLCFDLATMEDGQRRKTSASRRFVPIHAQLKQAMFALPSMDPTNSPGGMQRNLFGLSEGFNGRWSYSASRWINDRAIAKLKESGSIRNDKRLTLYSLRHSVVTQLKHKGVSEDLLAELVGHTNSSMTTGRYGKRYPVQKLKEVVDLIEW